MPTSQCFSATQFFLATRCACGFGRLEDEEVIDHLLAVFDPDDSRGADGKVHLEDYHRVCSCGFTGASAGELDAHFLAVFMPADPVDRDGVRHRPAR
jgi:hypothetical protein